MDKAFLLLMAFLIAARALAAEEKSMGTYDCVKLINMGSCPGTDFPMRCNWRPHRSAQGRYWTGDRYLPFALDDKIGWTSILYRWSKDGWKFFAKSVTSDSCKTMRDILPRIFREFVEDQDIPADCPWPEGTYHIRNFSACIKPQRFPHMPYGRLRLEVNFTRLEEQVGCEFYDLVINPAS